MHSGTVGSFHKAPARVVAELRIDRQDQLAQLDQVERRDRLAVVHVGGDHLVRAAQRLHAQDVLADQYQVERRYPVEVVRVQLRRTV